MKLYEVLLIIDPTLSAEGIENTVNQVKSVIEKHGGKFEKVFNLGKKKLGYPIENKDSGNLQDLFFGIEPESLILVDKDLPFINELMRFSIYKTDKVPNEAPTFETKKESFSKDSK